MPELSDYNEQNISQKPAINLLNKIGYNLISPEDAEKMRGNLYNVLLKKTLKEQLEKLNSYNYKSNDYKFEEKNIKQAITDLDELLTDGLVKTNEKIYDSLLLGRSYQENLFDGTKRSFTLKYIDWENIENNVFNVVEEFSVEREDGNGHVRPDIVLFINGIPFAVIECKKSSISMKQGISQMLRNQGKEYIPQLFKFVQIVMSTNKNETMYASISTPEKFWAVWKEYNIEWHQKILTENIKDRKITNQDENIVSLFHPSRILELTKFFIIFDKDLKKIARYQQYFAIKEVIKTIEEKNEINNRQSGVIWHTQGSGKSLTMVMLAKFILSELSEYDPKVIIVTDRIELDKQINRTFNHTRLKASRATSGKNLINLINSNSADIITTLVHKFDTAVNNSKPIESKDVFILVDESHRTQYGELNIKMKKVFPNACYLGFTGTPLMKKEKNTMIKFGKLIHKYTILDGVKDGAIVPLLYEGKMVEQTVNRNAIDKRLEVITRNLNEKQQEEVRKKWSRFEKIASSDQRIQMIAFDINEHFLNNYKTKSSQFKSMLAVNSKIEAVRYLEAFEELDDLTCAVVISPPDQREGIEVVDQESRNKILKFWNNMMSKYKDYEDYEDSIKNEFTEGDEIDLIIVVDKLLTGFDAPRATVLYIDKQMKEHTLLQAIARVNRIYEGKDYGLIIDYRGLLEKLDEAMDMYSGAGLENFDPEDLKGALFDVISIIGTLRHFYTQLINIFIPIKNKNDIEEYEVLLANEELREDFYKYLSGFSRNMLTVFESEQVYNALGQNELQKYKKDLKFFQELRKTVKLRYSDTIDHKEYEEKMQKLMDNYISSEEVIRITNPINILDKIGFEEELKRLGTPRSKADAIKTRMTKSLSEKWDENPAYYKKFSERIEDVLSAYKEARISEAEYLNKMQELLSDYRKGYSGYSYPENINNNSNAQAFYGVVSDVISEYKVNNVSSNLLGEISLKINKIFETHVKVDFHNNIDVHNKIAQEIDDLLFEYSNDYGIKLDIELIDKIIENAKIVALRRF
jgi:type I restriction enzyme R subunit